MEGWKDRKLELGQSPEERLGHICSHQVGWEVPGDQSAAGTMELVPISPKELGHPSPLPAGSLLLPWLEQFLPEHSCCLSVRPLSQRLQNGLF